MRIKGKNNFGLNKDDIFLKSKDLMIFLLLPCLDSEYLEYILLGY